MWEIYEEKHQFIHPIEFLLLISKIEGGDSEALNLLHIEKKFNRLYGQHLVNYNRICLDYQIEEKFIELKEDAVVKGQEEFVEKINDLKKHVDERISKSVEKYDKAIEEQDLLVTKERKEGLQKQIEQLGKRISDSFTNTRLFLIFISIIFTLIAGAYLGLTGWLISLLVKLMDS